MPQTMLSSQKNKTAKLLKHFSHQENFRPDYVQKMLAQGSPEISRASGQEMIALMVIWMAQQPVDDVILTLDRLCNSAWSDKFNDEFFALLERNAYDLHRDGLDQDAANLLKIGELAARMTNAPSWASHFQELITQNTWAHIRDLPYWKQRPW